MTSVDLVTTTALVTLHPRHGRPWHSMKGEVMFMKNIAIAGGFLFLVACGPGAYALATTE